VNRFHVLLILIVGCDAHAAPPGAQQGAESATTARTREHMVRSPSSDRAESPPTSDRTAFAGGRRELVERFSTSDLLALTPEQARARFSDQLELQRERESIDGFVLAGGTAAHRLELDYSPDGKDGFYISVASLLFYASSAQVAELQNALRDQLTKKLGKPKKKPADRESSHWKLSRQVEVVLIEYPSRRPNPGERVVELRMAEPGGP